MRHRAKFRSNRKNRCGDMVIFRFLNMATAAALDFQNVEISGAGTLKTAKMRHRANFHVDRSNLAEIWRFYDFSRWRPPPPSWIFKM